jgi:hypothetical protein
MQRGMGGNENTGIFTSSYTNQIILTGDINFAKFNGSSGPIQKKKKQQP